MFKSPGISAFSDDEECKEGEEGFGDEYEAASDSDEFEAAAAEDDVPVKKASSKAAAAAAAAAFNPVIAAQNAFTALSAASEAAATVAKDSGATVVTNEEKIAITVANALRGLMGPAMPMNDGSKELLVTLGWPGTFKELIAGRATHIQLKSKNPQLKAILGGDKVPLRAMRVVSFENKFPVSFGISGEHLKGKKFATHITDTGLHMLETPAKSSLVFPQPIKVYQALDCQFKREMAKCYPNIKISDIGTDIVPMGNQHKGFKLVPEGSIVYAGIQSEIQRTTKEMQARGEAYSGVRPEKIAALGMYKVADDLAISAVNTLRKSFAETDDLIDVDEHFYLVAERSRISSAAIDTLKSQAAASVWADKRELNESLKSGHTFENQLEKRYDLTLTVAVQISE